MVTGMAVGENGYWWRMTTRMASPVRMAGCRWQSLIAIQTYSEGFFCVAVLSCLVAAGPITEVAFSLGSKFSSLPHDAGDTSLV